MTQRHGEEAMSRYIVMPLRVREKRLGCTHLSRKELPFPRQDLSRLVVKAIM